MKRQISLPVVLVFVLQALPGAGYGSETGGLFCGKWVAGTIGRLACNWCESKQLQLRRMHVALGHASPRVF